MDSQQKQAEDIRSGIMARYPSLALMHLISVAIPNPSLIASGTTTERLLSSLPSLKKNGTMLLSVQKYSSRGTVLNIHDFWLSTSWLTSSNLENLVTYFSEYPETAVRGTVLSLLEVKDHEKYLLKS